MEHRRDRETDACEVCGDQLGVESPTDCPGNDRGECRKFITRDMLRAERDRLFVFGDNLKRRGLGGQAGEMRGESNAVGIPTKVRPGRERRDYFVSTVACRVDFFEAVEGPCRRLLGHRDGGGGIVWPADGIGTGLAQLEQRAPCIFVWLEGFRLRLETGR